MRFCLSGVLNNVKAQSRALAVAAGIVGALCATTGNVSAAPLNDFWADPTVFGGPAGGDGCPVLTTNCFIADKIVGNYVEVITITGPGTFATEAYWDLGQFVANDGTSPLAGTGLNTNYAMYALFSATGFFSPNALGGFDFVSNAGSVSLYVDPQLDGIAPPAAEGKTLPATAPGAITVTNFANDTLLGSASLFSGTGQSQGAPCNPNPPSSQNCGGFALLFFPFNWTATGSSFFVSPTPFYLSADLRGQFNTFAIPAGCTVGTFGTATCSQNLNGSADASFGNSPIPEPATLTLLGIGLVGAAAARRRRQKV